MRSSGVEESHGEFDGAHTQAVHRRNVDQPVDDDEAIPLPRHCVWGGGEYESRIWGSAPQRK